MGITEEIKIGKSRSDDDLRKAISVVEKEIVSVDFSNSTLFVQLPTIREALKELLDIRRWIKATKTSKVPESK